MIQAAPIRAWGNAPGRMPVIMMPRPRGLAGFSWSGAAGQVLPYLPASGAWGQASSIAQSAGSAISAAGLTTGPLAAAGAAVPIIGAGLAAVGLASNLIKCGTITSLGCTKRADTDIDKEGEIAARKVLWLAESGQVDGPTAKAQIAQIWNEMLQSWQQPQRSGYTSSFDGFCGNGNDPGQPPFYQRIGAPANSQAATYLCGQNGITRQYMFQVAFPALIDRMVAARPKPAPAQPVTRPAGPIAVPASGNIKPTGTPAALAPAANAAAASSSGIGTGTLALAGAGILGLFLLAS